jgi:adenylate cyclase
MACCQISLLGWREGLSLQDVQAFIDEAMLIATRTDPQLTQLLLMVEGRMLQASGGPADWYVERLHQALSLARPHGDDGRRATLSAALSQAYGWAGRLNEALRANDAALAGVADIDKFDREFIGFDPEQWILGMRGRLMTRLGRHDEAQQCWKRMLAIEGNGGIDPAVQLIAHLGQVEHAWWTNDPAPAQEHATHLAVLAEKHAVPYLKTVAANCRGMALSLSQDFSGALDAFSQAIQLVRSANVGAEYESEILASLAECHRRNGDAAKALSVAREAIEISRQRCTRLPECRALITLGSAIIDHAGANEPGEAEGVFMQAEELIRETGAVIYEPTLLLARSRLPARPERAIAAARSA